MYTGVGFHTCDGSSKKEQWHRVLKWCRYDEHYELIFHKIKSEGFQAPLAARLNGDQSVTFYDGHHRICVAEDLAMVQVPVYIGQITMRPEDLIAVDSRGWDGSTLNSPFMGMVA